MLLNLVKNKSECIQCQRLLLLNPRSLAMFRRVMIGMQTSSREGKCYLDITLHWDTGDPLNPVSGPVL